MNSSLVFLIVFGVVILAVILIYNGIISRANAAQRAWANVITQERQKNKIIPHLQTITDQYQQFESGVQEKIAALRSALGGLSSEKMDTAKLAEVESATRNLVQGMHIAVENYPELKANELFGKLMREIAEQQENIGAAIRIFNQNVEAFNNGIEMFPHSLVNSLLNKKSTLHTFNDSEAEAGFDYKPNF
ncbi:LemA family protein [Paraglaciecola sp.]|uniref:LemA family protein n=1 Tax=Paraglaciecola sp. TaxID=1920173 RepID=UPI00273E67F2|nr:LemA family protein [Paraglaciecola sp.]MDP5029919.1 LemA family protein [Paraglaciecola sp.]